MITSRAILHQADIMKITRVHATPLNLPVTVTVSGRTKTTALLLWLVDIECDDGHVGTGAREPRCDTPRADVLPGFNATPRLFVVAPAGRRPRSSRIWAMRSKA
ncbi:hypothetical protein [Reyranella sp. CPCC 100927]|uniref:hypothetical protein n=1 Tax=Reyranella sp. CPCC 100927 TaxID=2599616 RepID=UPI0015B59EA8|nr:hypothetical protein [Reyranella sp. CPCC 100927]